MERLISKIGHIYNQISEKNATLRQMGVYTGSTRRLSMIFNYEKSELQPGYKRRIIEPFLIYLQKNNKYPLILDLGSGDGQLGEYLRNQKVRVVDLDICRSGFSSNKEQVQAAGWKLPFKDNVFDGIHSKDMLVHVPQRLRNNLFSELKRVMKKNGMLVITSAEQPKSLLCPYQYPTFLDRITKTVQKQGLLIDGVDYWFPESGYRDWYGYNWKLRFVLKLVK